jgi:ketosteroid isomerase-like protein
VVKPAAEAAAVSDVEQAVAAWAQAWSAKDMKTYLGAYGKEFDPAGNQTRSEWEGERRKRIAGKSRISVKIEKLAVTVTGNQAVATFRQEYRADALAVSSRKTLDFVKSGDRWVIVRESTGG